MLLKRKWTVEDVAQLIVLFDSKANVRMISQRLGRTRAAVAGRLKKISDEKKKPSENN